MGGIADFLFGRKALRKAASTGGSTPQPNPGGFQPAGIDIAAEAQKMSTRAKGNDAGVGSRGSSQRTQPNDVGLKGRASKLPAQPTQPNDVGLKGGNDHDEDDY